MERLPRDADVLESRGGEKVALNRLQCFDVAVVTFVKALQKITSPWGHALS